MSGKASINLFDDGDLEANTPIGMFACIWEPVGIAEGDHRYFVERDGRHFLRILHRVGFHEQVYLLEVFPEKSVS